MEKREILADPMIKTACPKCKQFTLDFDPNGDELYCVACGHRYDPLEG